MNVQNLVLSGGHIKGISYIGVFKYIEELGLKNKIKNILGVSSGAIFSLMYCLGLSSSQLEHIILSLSLDDFSNLSTDALFNITKTFGIDSGNKISKIFKIIIKKILGNDNATFKDLQQYSNVKLIIAGTNLNTYKCEYFSVDTTPEMPLHIALRISTSVPIYFNPVLYNNSYYIDAAFSNNFPINYFDDDIKNTMGIVLNDSEIENSINSLGTYIYMVTNCVMSIMQNHLKNIYSDNTIELFINYNTLEMRFDKEIKKNIIDEGYSQFRKCYKSSKFNINIDKNNLSELDSACEVKTIIDSLQEELNSNTSY